MIGSWRSFAGKSGPAIALAALLLTAGCSWFGGENKLPKGQSAYPSLATVPTQAPPASSNSDRQQTVAGLVADRDNAAYSDQPLTAQSEQAGSTPAPAPETVTSAAQPSQPDSSQSGSGQAGSGQADTTQQPAAPATPAPAPQVSAQPLAPQPAANQPAASQPAAPAPAASQTQAASQTPAPAPVDNGASAPAQPAGNAPGGGRELAQIYFGGTSTSLSNHDLTVLHEVYLLQQQGGGRLRLVGQSQARANVVAHALLDMGAPTSAVVVAGAGDAAAVQAETTTTGQDPERRVDIFLDR
jgi:hypothetical protein